MTKLKVLVDKENLDIAEEYQISLSKALNTIIQIQLSLKEDLPNEEKDEIINKIKSIQYTLKK